MPDQQPTLTDGVVTLHAFGTEHIDAHVAGEDDEVRLWFGRAEATTAEGMRETVERWQAERSSGTRLSFAVVHDGVSRGVVEVRPRGETAALSWMLYAGQRGQGYAARAVRLLVDWALTEQGQGGLGMHRVEAEVDPRNQASLRVATRAGLHREGVRRVTPGMADREDSHGIVVLARLSTDPPLSDPQSFRSLLNSFLPRKRAIGQVLLRDPAGRVLLCRLTYKRDWDLPGGVVEVGESPRLAAVRELEEELGLTVAPGELLLTDWLPSWGGWDDAVCLVFDGGTHDPSVLDDAVLQAREIREARFLTLDEVDELAADFTARRIRAAVAGRTPYTESGS